MGNTENAVLIQMYTALTVYLLLAYQKFLSQIGLLVQHFFQLIQLKLLVTRFLEELLTPRQRKRDNPYNFRLLNVVA